MSPSRLALSAPHQEPGELEPLLPHAPRFRDMCHLLTRERLVLCYTASGPAFGAVEDLLSMAVVGKPGRGKTTALLYYVAILLYAEAEVHVWDPHGSMSELAQVHPHLSYLDSLEDLPASITYLRRALEQRDLLYKQRKQVQHPLLLLVDELPVIGDVEKVLRKRGVEEEQTPTFLIKRFVLEARKWRCFFIASGQSTDAEILPTRVTENLSSRIIFFSSDRRARMAGLEQEAVKKFLPVIRRAGPGVMIFDCSSWDEPVLGAIPETTVEDLRAFLGAGHGPERAVKPEQDLQQAFTVPLGPIHRLGHTPATGSTPLVLGHATAPFPPGASGVNVPWAEGEASSPELVNSVNAPQSDRDGLAIPPGEEARIITAALHMRERDGVIVRTRLLEELGENRKYWPILKAVLDTHEL